VISRDYTSVVIIEDDPIKRADIEAMVREYFTMPTVSFASSVREADELLDKALPDFVVLDISMNISPESQASSRAAHANLGGLEIVERQWLLGIEVPTLVLTGFDYFRAPGKGQHAPEAYNLADLELKLKEFLGDKLIGCVKYGSSTWKDEFRRALLTFETAV
jgi:CheY-like chemotaxis protein